MRITRYFNCTQAEIDSKKFNIYLGISLGNKYFSKEHLREYLKWAFEYTRERILFVIADINHAKNYEVFSKYSSGKALRRALRDGDKVVATINELLAEFPEEERHRVTIIRWGDLQATSYYQDKQPLVMDEFKNNQAFNKYILDIVDENLKDRVAGLDVAQKDKLAEYVLDEIPIMVNGITWQGTLYNLYPYPGTGLYDELLMGLQNKTLFPELAQKLEITNRSAEVEAFVTDNLQKSLPSNKS